MRFVQKKTYKSLHSIKTQELPDFVVLTGLNGAGKTHLLEAIYREHIDAFSGAKRISNILEINRVPRLSENNSSGEIYDRILQNLYARFNNAREKVKEKLIDFGLNEIMHHWGHSDRITNKFLLQESLQQIMENAQKDLNQITEEDFINFCPQSLLHHYSHDTRRFFSQSLTSIFKTYQSSLCENLYAKFLAGLGENKTFFTDEEFQKRFGPPPWIHINKLFKRYHLDYRVNFPTYKDYRDSGSFKAILQSIGNPELTIPFDSLSSGESILLGLAISIYNATQTKEFPELLLIDEIDGFLHPSMLKEFLSALKAIYVDELNMKIVMVTHSPSTVALAPENSIYVMNKERQKLRKVAKDKAIRLLTSGVPTLSIYYENRKQVFVESHSDAYFYNKIYELLQRELEPEISLSFIATGNQENGGCAQVNAIVKQLRDSGNPCIYGIIDWDLKNNGNQYVKVLGYKKRYSIENYIFDPLYIAFFLLKERIISVEELGLDKNFKARQIQGLRKTQLQNIIDYITSKVRMTLIENSKLDEEPIFVQNKRFKTLTVPKWYLEMNGHTLEEKLKDAFRPLRGLVKSLEKRRRDLKREVLDTVINEFEDYLPTELTELFESIQQSP